jgi:hypothetical protein
MCRSRFPLARQIRNRTMSHQKNFSGKKQSKKRNIVTVQESNDNDREDPQIVGDVDADDVVAVEMKSKNKTNKKRPFSETVQEETTDNGDANADVLTVHGDHGGGAEVRESNGSVDETDTAAEMMNNRKRKQAKKEKKLAEKALAAGAADANGSEDDAKALRKKAKADKKQKKREKKLRLASAGQEYVPKEWENATNDGAEPVAEAAAESIAYEPVEAETEYPPFQDFNKLRQFIPEWLIESSCGSFRCGDISRGRCTLHENEQRCCSKPTPVQACTWPLAFARREVIGVARTGSGKVRLLRCGVDKIE